MSGTYRDVAQIRPDEVCFRYSFNEDHTLIRANQGHSIPVDVELEEKTPPDIFGMGQVKNTLLRLMHRD